MKRKFFLFCFIFMISISLICWFIVFQKILKIEPFQKLSDGKLCGQISDPCRIDEEGHHNCCDGNICLLPKGKYQHKICVNKNSRFLYNYNVDDESDINASFDWHSLVPNFPLLFGRFGMSVCNAIT